MPSILGVFILQFFYLLEYKQNTGFVAFLKLMLCFVMLCFEAYVGCPLYRNAEEILDEAILGNLVQLLPSELEVLISNFFLQVTAA